jgi:BspA type Leucine rich repeat region (6 copies)
MKTFFSLLIIGLAVATAQAQFTYITNNGAITITGYTGTNPNVAIPGTIDGLMVTDIGTNGFEGSALTSVTIPNSVTGIGDYAFYACVNLTNVTMGSNVASIGNYAFSGPPVEPVVGDGSPGPPDGCPLTSVTILNSVTNIGTGAFSDCDALTAFNVAPGNSAYSSVGGVLFNHDQSTLVEFPNGLGGSYTIPNSVTNIGDYAFYGCTSLTNVVLDDNLISIGAYAFSGAQEEGATPVSYACRLTSITVPASVTNIGDYAFQGCGPTAYFLGNAPDADATVFSWGVRLPQGNLTAYYLPGTTGWAEFTANTGVPTALWTLPYPLILNGSSGVQVNQFGFTISWATNVPVVVEASSDLSNPVWTPVATNTLSSGTSSFIDPDWTNYPNRFYRVQAQ